MPYSGPVSSYGQIGRAEAAYFKMINTEQGGINGAQDRTHLARRWIFSAENRRDGRQLVEQDEVRSCDPLGTPSNSAIHSYLNGKKIPQLFVASGASKWNDPKNYPWTMGWQPNYQTEARIYAQQILKTKPAAKIAILYQNDDFGKDYVKGFKDELGTRRSSSSPSSPTR